MSKINVHLIINSYPRDLRFEPRKLHQKLNDKTSTLLFPIIVCKHVWNPTKKLIKRWLPLSVNERSTQQWSRRSWLLGYSTTCRSKMLYTKALSSCGPCWWPNLPFAEGSSVFCPLLKSKALRFLLGILVWFLFAGISSLFPFYLFLQPSGPINSCQLSDNLDILDAWRLPSSAREHIHTLLWDIHRTRFSTLLLYPSMNGWNNIIVCTLP